SPIVDLKNRGLINARTNTLNATLRTAIGYKESPCRKARKNSTASKKSTTPSSAGQSEKPVSTTPALCVALVAAALKFARGWICDSLSSKRLTAKRPSRFALLKPDKPAWGVLGN